MEDGRISEVSEDISEAGKQVIDLNGAFISAGWIDMHLHCFKMPGMKGYHRTGLGLKDVKKCKLYPYREGCYKEGSKTKSFSVTLMSTIHSEQKTYQETEELKALAKASYKIEAKNSELKHGMVLM